MQKSEEKKCSKHDNHNHTHSSSCGHKAVQHDDHIDYIHDGHFHRIHGDHVDECSGPKKN